MKTSTSISNSRSIIRNTFYIQLAAFILLSLSSSVGSMVDGVVIGQFLGVDSIAAFGIINPLMIAFSIIGAVVSAGARNRFTRLLGAGKTEQARNVFSLACILSAGIAAALMVFLLVFSGPVTSALGASKKTADLLPKARDYLIGISFGLPAMNLVRVLNGFMPLDNDRNLPVLSSIFLTVSDIVLDLAAILVLHGDTLEMGIATSISYYVALAVLLTHFRKKDCFLRFSFKGLPWGETGAVLGKGMPSGVCRLGNTLRCIFMNRMLAIIASSAAIAAYSVHRQADSFFNPVTIGMADTVALLAGILVGEEDRPMMKRLLFTSVQATFIIRINNSSVMGSDPITELLHPLHRHPQLILPRLFHDHLLLFGMRNLPFHEHPVLLLRFIEEIVEHPGFFDKLRHELFNFRIPPFPLLYKKAIAAVFIFTRRLDHLRLHGIEVDIPAHFQKIPFISDQNCLISPLEQMPG